MWVGRGEGEGAASAGPFPAQAGTQLSAHATLSSVMAGRRPGHPTGRRAGGRRCWVPGSLPGDDDRGAGARCGLGPSLRWEWTGRDCASTSAEPTGWRRKAFACRGSQSKTLRCGRPSSWPPSRKRHPPPPPDGGPPPPQAGEDRRLRGLLRHHYWRGKVAPLENGAAEWSRCLMAMNCMTSGRLMSF